MIELGQLGNSTLYLHANNNKDNNLINDLQSSLKLEKNTLVGSVPPASIQRFLLAKPNITAVVLASHGSQFVNKYYGGLFDSSETINIVE